MLADDDRSAECAKGAKSVIRATAGLRDSDVIASRLRNAGIQADSELLSGLYRTRGRLQARACTSILKFKDDVKEFESPEVGRKHLEVAYNKQVASLERRLEKQLSGILNPEPDVELLHSCRKTARRLRYMYELTGAGMAHKMVALQDMLGEIRDIDLTLDYIGAWREIGLGAVRASERRRRRQLLSKLIASRGDEEGRKRQKG